MLLSNFKDCIGPIRTSDGMAKPMNYMVFNVNLNVCKLMFSIGIPDSLKSARLNKVLRPQIGKNRFDFVEFVSTKHEYI